MRKNLFFSVFFLVLAACCPCVLFAASADAPVTYPYGDISNAQPYFVWQDIYWDVNAAAKCRVVIKPADQSASAYEYTVSPERYYKTYLCFKLPAKLAAGKYEYRIERLYRTVPDDKRYYGYRHYPVTGAFVVDAAARGGRDALAPDSLIRYLNLEHHNTLDNGYNALFLGGAGTVSLGMGVLCLTVIDFGIITKVIAAVSLVSSAASYTACGVYSYRYFSNRRELAEIIKKGNTSIRAGINHGVYAAAERAF